MSEQGLAGLGRIPALASVMQMIRMMGASLRPLGTWFIVVRHVPGVEGAATVALATSNSVTTEEDDSCIRYHRLGAYELRQVSLAMIPDYPGQSYSFEALRAWLLQLIPIEWGAVLFSDNDEAFYWVL